MDKFFAAFGKIALILALITTVGFGSYFLGQKSKVKTPKEIVTKNQGELTVDIIPSSGEVTVIPTSNALKTALAGVDKNAGLSYSQYSISFPASWTELREAQTANDDKLTLEKEGKKISIFQGATGGAMCLYSNDPDFEGPSSRYDNFSEIKTQDGTILRRGGTIAKSKDGSTGFTFCQENSEGKYGQPTMYGHISASIAGELDSKDLDEIDAIIASLKKR